MRLSSSIIVRAQWQWIGNKRLSGCTGQRNEHLYCIRKKKISSISICIFINSHFSCDKKHYNFNKSINIKEKYCAYYLFIFFLISVLNKMKGEKKRKFFTLIIFYHFEYDVSELKFGRFRKMMMNLIIFWAWCLQIEARTTIKTSFSGISLLESNFFYKKTHFKYIILQSST